MEARILIAGESCFFVDFGNRIDRELNARVQGLKGNLEKDPFPGMGELIPTYRSLAVYFDPLKVELSEVKGCLERALRTPAAETPEANLQISIPVCYGGSYGPDLEKVAESCGISVQEVISRHSGSELYCYMLGFTPGFPYLGGMDPSIATPRLANPRKVIAAGSVGIAGAQTGVYPTDSPGGWQIIGRTPLKLYDPQRRPPTAIQPGMTVKFYPITPKEFEAIQEQSLSGQWELEIFKRRQCS